ncbi:TlpA family protein disulfide reductase [Pedobacter sp. KLB.chiD]|uniref:TlpA family protein disulfide reductase n=1 Tax=Pedobacter sp. KLB.chiD TaxID=3387402 RepID=UPI00399C35FF
MKKNLLLSGLLLLCPFFGQQLAAQTLTWKPGLLRQNQPATFYYQAKGGDLEFSDEPQVTLAYFNGKRWNTLPLKLKKDKDQWQASYALPANAVFLALKFYQGPVETPEASDNNQGKGYFARVVGNNGKEQRGSYLAEAALRAGLTGDWSLNSFVSPEKNTQITDYLLKEEEKISGKSIGTGPALFTYLNLKRSIMPADDFNAFADAAIQSAIKKAKYSEALLTEAHNYYIREKRDQQAKEIEKLIFQYQPKSGAAKLLSFRAATKGASTKTYQLASEDFLEKYPYAEWKKTPDDKGFLYYEIYRGLGTIYFDSNQIGKFLSLFKDIDFRTANEIYRWNITRNQMSMSGKADYKLLYELSKKIIPYLLERQRDQSYLTDFGRDAVKAQENADKQMNDRLFTHIALAINQKDFVAAKNFFQYLSKDGIYSNAEMNAMHLRVLSELKDNKGIKPLLENSVAANAVTPEMFSKLKELYKSERQGQDQGYEEYLSSLMPNDKKAEMRTHVLANMVNFPLKPFSLEDANGNLVNSNDWGTKIVVIDFWATWCRPCIEAFPGMQLLVDQYANDPQIGVYMIGTMQTGDYKAKSVNYVKSQGFRFHLLHDAVSASGAQDQVFKSLLPLFKQSSIPRKIVVKNGVVRYTSEGYSGSPSQLRDELSTAIEILRAEK